MSTTHATRSAFTLVELMVAVVVLVVIIAATSRIFGTVSRVTGIGNATADVLQEAAAIERRIREDFDRLGVEGWFTIQCVAVRNDINGSPLLNPLLPPNAPVRCDQLVMFTQGVQGHATLRQQGTSSVSPGGTNRWGQSTLARVYWGHAVQLPLAQPFGAIQPYWAHDLDQSIWPWYVGNVATDRTRFEPGVNTFDRVNAGSIDGTQPPAPQWLLARQPVIMVDDDGSTNVFLGNNISCASFLIDDPFYPPSPQVRDGRVDACAANLNDLKRAVTNYGAWNWITTRNYLFGPNVLYYPRAERLAPGPSRVDQALTNHVIGTACSDFRIEWTYENGTGAVTRPDGSLVVLPGLDGMPDTLDDVTLRGIYLDPAREQPWFGLPDLSRGVTTFGFWESYTGDGSTTFQASLIEGGFTSPTIETYTAGFGFNGDRPIDAATGLRINYNAAGALVNNPNNYTPWPSAVRITMTLHDPEGRLENGQTFQFVVRLPKRRG